MFFRSRRIDPLLERSRQHLEAEEPEAALAAADEALAIAPRSAEAHVLRGAALFALGRGEEALAAYERAVSLDRRNLDALLGAADLLLDGWSEEEGAFERALAYGERGARLARKAKDDRMLAEFLLIEGTARNLLGDPRGALERLDAAAAILPEDYDVQAERAAALFETCRFDEARRLFEALLERDPEDPRVHHHLGLLAERRGEEDRARRHFERATELAPEDYPPPVRCSEAEFDRAVEEALERLPEPVRRYLSNVAIATEPFPDEGDLAGGDVSPTVLGLFRGSPLAEKASMDPWAHFPSSIVLYQRNLERFARDREELIEQIDITLLHEVGHFLGLDEEDLAERGLD